MNRYINSKATFAALTSSNSQWDNQVSFCKQNCKSNGIHLQRQNVDGSLHSHSTDSDTNIGYGAGADYPRTPRLGPLGKGPYRGV